MAVSGPRGECLDDLFDDFVVRRAGPSPSTLWLLALTVLSVAGCASANDAGDGGDGFVLSDEEIQQVIAAAGPSQVSFIEDRVITPAERERAYLNFVECSRAEGVEVFEWSLNPYGGDSFNTRLISGDPSDEDEIGGNGEAVEGTPSIEERVVEVCRGEHYTAVGVLYEFLNRRSGAELEEFEQEIAECMRRQSISVPEGADISQMSDIDRTASNLCFLEADG